MRRRELRELTLQSLFQIDFSDANVADVFAYLQEENDLNDKDLSFIGGKVNGTLAHLKEVDKEIAKYLKDWTFDIIPISALVFSLPFTYDCDAGSLPTRITVSLGTIPFLNKSTASIFNFSFMEFDTSCPLIIFAAISITPFKKLNHQKSIFYSVKLSSISTLILLLLTKEPSTPKPWSWKRRMAS